MGEANFALSGYLFSGIGKFNSSFWYEPYPIDIQYALNPIFLTEPLCPPYQYSPKLRCFLCRHILKHFFLPQIVLLLWRLKLDK